MIPVPSLERVQCAWVEIVNRGFKLHGFLAFLPADQSFPEYLDDAGLGELDLWTGKECGVFVVQSPSAAWIEYTKQNNHPWWQIFGNIEEPGADLIETLETHGDAPVIQVQGTRQSLRDAFAPCLNQLHRIAEIGKILYRFNLNATDHPCLILFKDLNDSTVWYVDLSDLLDISRSDLRLSLRRWFSGPEFRKILKEARNA